jgi:hypothetical protein
MSAGQTLGHELPKKEGGLDTPTEAVFADVLKVRHRAFHLFTVSGEEGQFPKGLARLFSRPPQLSKQVLVGSEHRSHAIAQSASHGARERGDVDHGSQGGPLSRPPASARIREGVRQQ